MENWESMGLATRDADVAAEKSMAGITFRHRFPKGEWRYGVGCQEEVLSLLRYGCDVEVEPCPGRSPLG